MAATPADQPKYCKKCCCYYGTGASAEPDGCRFHPGVFEPCSRSIGATRFGWTCCRQLAQDSPPCKRRDAHVEDVEFSTRFQGWAERASGARRTRGDAVFGDSEIGALGRNPSLADAPDASAEPCAPPSYHAALARDAAPPPAYDAAEAPGEAAGVAVHAPVLLTDTLAALALRYGTTTAALRKLNRLANDTMLYAKTELLVPCRDKALLPAPAPEEEKEREAALLRNKMFNTFMRKTFASEETTTYYLSLHEFDLEAALVDFFDDELWEREHPMPHAPAFADAASGVVGRHARVRA